MKQYRILVLALLAAAGCAQSELNGSESHFVKCRVGEDCREGTCDEVRGVCVDTDGGANPGQTPATVPVPDGASPAPGTQPPDMPPPDAPPPDMPALLPNPPAPETFDFAAAVAGKTPTLDSNGDGKLDGVWVDTDADGKVDAVAVDVNDDAIFDVLVRDLDSDGSFEATVEMPEPPPPPLPCQVELSVGTVDYGGDFGSNAGAIWVTDEAGAFIRSIEVWAAKSDEYVVKWVRSSNKDRTDAISGASASGYGVHNVTWNCTYKDGTSVPFGKYTLHTEFTAVRGDGPYLPITFERGEQPVEVTAGPQKGYSGATLKYDPTP